MTHSLAARSEQLAYAELDKAMKALADTPLHSLHDLENARRRVARRKAHWADTLRALDKSRTGLAGRAGAQ